MTLIGLQFGAVLTGAVITETIFAWPGIGRLLIQSIGFRDYPLVQGCILFIAVTYVGMNLLTDLVYGVLDPRIRYDMHVRLRGAQVDVRWRYDCDGRHLASSCRRIRRVHGARSVGPSRLAPFDPAASGAGAAARRTHRHALVRPRRARTRHLRARARRAPASRCWSAWSSSASRRRSGSRSDRSRATSAAAIDEAISRVIDILLAFPGLLLAIALVAVLGPSLTNVVLALSLIGWVGYARLVRGQVLRARELEFVQAARALGATTVADPDAARDSDDAACRHRAGDARHGRRDPGRGGAELSRPRRPAADAELGDDAELRARTPARRAAPDDLSRPRDRDARPRIQFSGRRIARRAGSGSAGTKRT